MSLRLVNLWLLFVSSMLIACPSENLYSQQPLNASWRSGVSRWTGTEYIAPKPTTVERLPDETDRLDAEGNRDKGLDVPLSATPYHDLANAAITGSTYSTDSTTRQVDSDTSSGGSASSARSFDPTPIQFKDGEDVDDQLPGRKPISDDLLSAPDSESEGRTKVASPEEKPMATVDSKPIESTTLASPAGQLSTSTELTGKNVIASESGGWSRFGASWDRLIPRRAWLQGWDSQAELGLDGSSGNASTLGVHTGFESKRSTKFFDLELDLDYRQTRNRSTTTEDNGRITSEFDRLFNESPHSAFGKFGAEWDRFKAFDLRLNLNGGYGYHWIRTDETSFVTKFGAGASREIGAPSDQWIPEAVFGVESERKWSSRQRMKQKIEYFPAWEDFGNFRLVADFSWETSLDEADKLRLKFSMNNRYDSTPQGARRNDLYYSLILLYKF